MENIKINQRLNEIPEWDLVGKTIQRQFELPDFKQAIEFTNKVADASDKADHHPDILIHNWNKVTITLTTHDKGGLTPNDFSLAGKISKIFADK